MFRLHATRFLSPGCWYCILCNSAASLARILLTLSAKVTIRLHKSTSLDDPSCALALILTSESYSATVSILHKSTSLDDPFLCTRPDTDDSNRSTKASFTSQPPSTIRSCVLALIPTSERYSAKVSILHMSASLDDAFLSTCPDINVTASTA